MAHHNPKSRLQEFLVLRDPNVKIEYKYESMGPPHNMEWRSACIIRCTVNGEYLKYDFVGSWCGGKRVCAEKNVAEKAMAFLKNESCFCQPSPNNRLDFTDHPALVQSNSERILVLIDAENRAAALRYVYPDCCTVMGVCTSTFPRASFPDREFLVAPRNVKGADGADVWLIFYLAMNVNTISSCRLKRSHIRSSAGMLSCDQPQC